ncbi:DNA polymerase-3 subunit epsilon [Novosphingobium sp. PhB165]|uniref:3'-5' exonuclease n=1 Tax=Novosphingobium sp. PhB165 TaxID=2485105 RepID=UPI00104FE1F4|nr:3'-5' exonuclease [Novosphingobium sp. PhB165]TCM16437.1 DNA polymerase-3 subunit epsilon [Novosphingobium sp. PhB165]
MSRSSPDALYRAAAFLDPSPDFRVLRRLQPVSRFHAPRPGGTSRIGVAIDVETTGLDHETDKIIELAIQRFRFDDTGRIVQVGQPRVWREDPGVPLDPRITKLTGLTNEVLENQKIDEALAIEILSSADLIIAHNARFDRPFVDKRLPAIAGKPWACSMAEPDWLELGFDGKALAHLVSQCGWFYEGHRAENDILALIYLLAHDLPDGVTILAKLLAASEQPSYRVNAIDAPFESKDLLKARGYRWNAALRFWSKEISATDHDDEKLWLTNEVYRGFGEPAFISVTACERHGKS